MAAIWFLMLVGALAGLFLMSYASGRAEEEDWDDWEDHPDDRYMAIQQQQEPMD